MRCSRTPEDPLTAKPAFAIQTMSALVTAADGFVGRHLTRRLSADLSVYGTTLAPVPPEDWPDDPVELRTCDVRDRAQVFSALDAVRPDRIYHLAGESHVPRSWEDPERTLETNLLGTLNLLEAVRTLCPQARVLCVSTADVYGLAPVGRPPSEDDPTVPTSPYAVSKLSAEQLAHAYHLRYGLHVVRVRPAIHTGPGQLPPFVLPSFCRRVARIETGLEPPLLPVGNLQVQRDFTDVRDMVRAYQRVLELAPPGSCFNIRWGPRVLLDDVVKHLLSRAHASISVEVDQALFRPEETARLTCDASRFMQLTGFVPEFSFERTVDDTLAYWRQRENPLTSERSASKLLL